MKRAPYQTSSKEAKILHFCPECELVFQKGNAYFPETVLWKGFPSIGLPRDVCKKCEDKKEEVI